MTVTPSREKEFLEKLAQITEANIANEQYGVSELAREMGMSRSNLHRKITSLTGQSVSLFIRNIRLQKAMELLKESSFTVSEVAYRVGFGSATYFSKCFHDHFGYPPGETGNKNMENSVTEPQQDPPVPYPAMTKRRIPVPWIISAFLVIVTAVILIITLRPFSGNSPPADKTIVVLPFRNDSPDEADDYIVNGLMDEIINKLTIIEDLKVVSRTTSETYRGSDKSLKEIGEELQVGYILQGSATIINNNTRIRLQLIDAVTDSPLWSKPYDRVITLDNIWQVQAEIALAVTDELKLVLKPEEKEQIERKPTENLEAYDAFMQANELLNILQVQGNKGNDPKVLKVWQLLKKAIDLDSTFTEAYSLLGHIYINKFYFTERWWDLEKAYAFMDTGLYYVEKALSYDSNHDWALKLKAEYFQRHGMQNEAEQLFLESNRDPDITYGTSQSDISWYIPYNKFYPGIKAYLKYLELKPDNIIIPTWIHEHMFRAYAGAGFPYLASQHSEQILALNNDSIQHYSRMVFIEICQGNYNKAIQYGAKICRLDPANAVYAARLGRSYIYSGDFDSGARLIRPLMDDFAQQVDDIALFSLAGYAYMELGEKKMAENLLWRDIVKQKKELEYPTTDTQNGDVHLHLASVYSILGDVENTMENLAHLEGLPSVHIGMINELKDWPSFDLVRELPEFKEILEQLENTFQKEHDRIAGLLEENGMIPR